jgi:hypothetical protein
LGRGYYDYPPAAAPQLHPNDELEMLKSEQQALQRSLTTIEQRINQLGADELSE